MSQTKRRGQSRICTAEYRRQYYTRNSENSALLTRKSEQSENKSNGANDLAALSLRIIFA
jgi:hypothetical protein